jgi:hypothetical protein
MGQKYNFFDTLNTLEGALATIVLVLFILLSLIPLAQGLQTLVQREIVYDWGSFGRMNLLGPSNFQGLAAILYGLFLIAIGIGLIYLGIILYRWIGIG